MGILKVSARSRSTAVAGAIAGVIRDGAIAEVQAIGPEAVNQAIKAIAIARTYLNRDGIAVVCVPALVAVEIEGQERTALKLTVQKPDQPLPPVTPLPRAGKIGEAGADMPGGSRAAAVSHRNLEDERALAVTPVPPQESAVRRHYEGRGAIQRGGMRVEAVEYAFDYDPDGGISGFVWSIDGRIPTRPTTSDLLLEKSDQFVPAYLSYDGLDPARKKFKFSLSLSDQQPDDPNNLAARR